MVKQHRRFSMIAARARTVSALLLLSGAVCAYAADSPLVLISEREASLPAPSGSDAVSRAGVTRGPKVVLLSPAAGAPTKAPLHLQIKFETFSGARIDLASVRVTYLRNPAVDLTQRLRSATGPDGIDVSKAAVPPGRHDIRVEITDSHGRAGAATFALEVTR